MSRLMTLEEAADTLHDTITVNTLRRAVREDRLRAAKYGTRRYYVTPEDLEDFVKCPASESPRASTSGLMKSNGSSGTETFRSGQDILKGSIERLKTRSPSTSPQKPCPNGQVRHIREN